MKGGAYLNNADKLLIANIYEKMQIEKNFLEYMRILENT
jgi:hypothetical protein